MVKDISDAQKFIETDVMEVMQDTYCTDYIHLTQETEMSLQGIWESNAKNITIEGISGCFVPSDLMFQNTIPLKDVAFTHETNGMTSTYRIHIFENYDEFLPLLENDGKTVVGIIEMLFSTYGIRYFIAITIFSDYINVLSPAYMGSPNGLYFTERTDKDKEAKTQIMSLGNNILGLWYAVQLCLLNPVTKVLFVKPTLQKLHGKEKVQAQKIDKSIKYVKHYYIKEEDVDNVLYGGDRSFNRKCLVWYVTGHWRTYKIGKKTFIKGYFKGALRNTPNQDVARQRELVFEESEGNDDKKVQVI